MSEPEVIADVIETIRFYPKLNSIPRNKRAPRAIRLLKHWVSRNLDVELENIIIHQEVNEFIWSRGIQKPPRKITIQAVKADDGVVDVYLASTELTERMKVVEVPASDSPIETDLDEDEDEEEEEE